MVHPPARRPRRRPHSALRLALVCAVALGIAGVTGSARAEALSEHPMIGEAAPLFRLPDLEGQPVDMKDLRGQYVVIHFATTWCPYCNAEAPSLNTLYENYRERGVRVLVVDVKEEKERVAAWAARHHWEFPVLLDSDGAVTSAYAPDVHPDLPRDEVPIASNLLVDREGRVQFYSLLDSRNFDAKLVALQQRLDALLEAE